MVTLCACITMPCIMVVQHGATPALQDNSMQCHASYCTYLAITLLHLFHRNGEDGVRPTGILIHHCGSYTAILLADL